VGFKLGFKLGFMPSLSSSTSLRRRGLSIVEILVAIGIVVAISAVAVPWTLGWLGSRELDDAGDRIAMQMLMARAAAREEGRAVEVVASDTDGQRSIEARWIDLSAIDEGEGVSRGDFLTKDGFPQSSIDAEWASFSLPNGMSLAVDAVNDDASSDASSEDGANEDTEGSFAGQTLALFLPDGTVLTAPIFMLRTDAGVARSMRVDRATGRARVVEQSKRPANELEEFVRPEFDLPESGMSEDSSDARDSYPRGKPVGARESSGAARSR
jgi:type II secretory pathway pseudopilin PulG